MNPYQYRYYLPDHGQGAEDSYQIESNNEPEFLEYVAQDAAMDYHNNHDGWESSWPLDFIILDEEGRELGRFEIDREYDPCFVVSTKRGSK